jgi:hypothetical protein
VLLDETLFHHFLDLVQDTRGDADESFNYDVIRLITVLNEQFLMSSQENVLMQVLQQRRADTFSANLIFMLNRSGKKKIVMICEMLAEFLTVKYRRQCCTNVDSKVTVLYFHYTKAIRILLYQRSLRIDRHYIKSALRPW